MKKSVTIAIIAFSFLVSIGASIFGTLYFTGFLTHGNFSRNFQINQTQIDDIKTFFSNNPSLSDAQAYCSKNRMECLYYCRSIDPNNGVCSQIANYTRMRNPQVGQ